MFDGLNLGLAINIADGASVNANKISSSIEKLIGLSNQLGRDTKKDSAGVDSLANSFNHADRSAHTGAGGVRAFGSSLERLEPRLISVRTGIIRLFPYVSVLGGLYAIKRGFDETMNTFSDYEYAMKNMQAATGYNVAEMNMLDKQFRQLAVGGRFTAKEIAEAGYDLTTTIEIEAGKVKDLTQSVLGYATATQYSVKESGLDMLSLLSKLNRPLSDSTILFDQMAKATNITSLTAQRLSEMLKITGTEALGMGVPFNTLLSLMGRTDLYYKGGEGGTRLRMMFQMLAQSTKIHGDILQKYGLSMQDVDIKSQGLYKVLGKLKGMEYGDLSRLVGGYSAGLVMRLSNDVKYMEEMQGKLTESASKGTTATMYDVQIHSLDGRRKQLKNIITEMQLTLADQAKQPYANFLGKIAGFVTEITEKMKLNSGVLRTIFESIFGWINGIGKMIAGHVRSILAWTGLLADTQEESTRLMRNNLLPFIVFVEVMGLRVWNFIKGFAQGFWDGAQLVWKAVSTIGGWIGDLLGWILPLGDQFKSLGYVLGLAVPLLWGLGKAAAILRLILPALGIELEGISVLTGIWNTVLLANPILLVGAGILAVFLVIRKHREEIQGWIDTLPDWAQAIASFMALGVLNDDKIGDRLLKLWNSVTSTIGDAFFWVVNRLNDVLMMLPTSVKMVWGIKDITPEDMKKAENRFRYGSDYAPTPKDESVIQYGNPKSSALATTMLTDKDAIKSDALSNKTASMYANFGAPKGEQKWGLPDAPKARSKLPETPVTPKVEKKESGAPATTMAAKKDQAVKHPGAPTVNLSPKIIVPRGEIPQPRVMPNATVDQVDTDTSGQEPNIVQSVFVPDPNRGKVPALAMPSDPKSATRDLATSLAKMSGGQVKVLGVGAHAFEKEVRKDAAKVMSPNEESRLGISDDLLDEYHDKATETMEGYKTTADSMMSKFGKGQEAPVAPRTVSPQTFDFKFGDIYIDAKGGDPEKIARELVPYIRKVVREEMKR